jgi:hypothetical protein
MSTKLHVLKYMLDKSAYNIDELKYYMDMTKYVIKDHERARQLIEVAKEIVEEALLP